MRDMLRGRAGMTLAFILGLMIATAGTATAAKLITGKQIKDGTITKKDLSKTLSKTIAKTGAKGVAGAPGSPGASGAPGAPGAPGIAGPPAAVRSEIPAKTFPRTVGDFRTAVVQNLVEIPSIGTLGVRCFEQVRDPETFTRSTEAVVMPSTVPLIGVRSSKSDDPLASRSLGIVTNESKLLEQPARQFGDGIAVTLHSLKRTVTVVLFPAGEQTASTCAVSGRLYEERPLVDVIRAIDE